MGRKGLQKKALGFGWRLQHGCGGKGSNGRSSSEREKRTCPRGEEEEGASGDTDTLLSFDFYIKASVERDQGVTGSGVWLFSFFWGL